MSINIPTHFISQFTSNTRLLLQEKGKLRGLTMSGSHVGKQASPVNQIGPLEMRTVTSRFTPKVRSDAAYARRWVAPTDFSLDQNLDPFDLEKTLTDPKGPYAETAALAAGRKFDDLIIDCAFATSATGETGTGTEAFDTAYEIAAAFGAAGEVGLTVEKMIEADRLFLTANVDLDAETKTMIVSPRQHSDLLRQIEVVSMDYQTKPILESGRVKNFLGYNIVISNRLTAVGDDRWVIAFVQSGLYLGTWHEIENDAHQRFDLEANPWELTTLMSAGATRLEQGRVIRILCDE